MKKITIIGGGLAGCEAAWQAAKRGADITLYEMKPEKLSPAHKSEGLAELVCSNSLRSNDIHNAPGVLKEEMRLMGSLIIEAADKTAVPAGSALAVDRELFSEYITAKMEGHKHIHLIREEVSTIPEDESEVIIIASGPLTSEPLSKAIGKLVGEGYLYFYDAISPIIDVTSINFDIAFKQSRYDKGEADYINCPMDKECYNNFIRDITEARQVATKDFEKEKFFEGCMPIEVMAARGPQTLSFGPMKPVGLKDERRDETPYAVVQLRQENRSASMYNMVGFQTRMAYPEQKRIFRTIPGLEKAEFLRLGSMHRNTYINSPLNLSPTLQLKKRPSLFFAGQISGVEGYIESASMGILAGINAALTASDKAPVVPPATTAMGGLVRHITESDPKSFQPMNINFGLLPPVERVNGKKLKKADRKAAAAERAINDMKKWIEEL
ncbi:MAG: methylenetetrahydrofolate--tRNA-(uracil(54)-C(5))-methyltransferase (FADH(2)-oxidizing) TrmFO [bacterium]|nr:methylenetetrahydrofolate--tRNA-(uracil(54)-C(5))-methyltransferase (FADH(2)-oxidizing) TrmFO [bacterium]